MTYKIKMNPLKILCKWQRLTVAVLLISLCGCSTFLPDRWYLHNPVNKEWAEQAKSNWTPNQANLWQNLLKNQKLTSNAELQAQRTLQQAVVSSNHIVIINTSWSDLIDNAKKYKNDLEGKKKKLNKEKKQALVDKTEIGKNIEELIKDKESRGKAIIEAQKNQSRWQAELVLFEKATQEFLLQQAIENRDIEGVKPKSTKEILNGILNEEITTVDNDGKDVQKPIREFLPDTQVKLIESLANDSGMGTFLKENSQQLDSIAEQAPPGIIFQILSLGADLAKAKLDREKAIKNRLDEEIKLFSKRGKEIAKALKWINNAITEIGSHGFNHEINNTVFESIQNSLNNNTTPNTEGLIRKLQIYVLAEDLYTLSDNSFDIAKSSLLHYYAIEDSAISAREHESLIQRGLETLAVYHAGGITQEEINSILQAAQAVALGIISERVF